MKLRIRLDRYEVEVEGSKDEVLEVLNNTLEYVSLVTEKLGEVHTAPAEYTDGEEMEKIHPVIEMVPGESTTAILEKLFSTSWASRPRSLREVVEALASMGIHYPKSTVAVSLMRLVKRGFARRIRSKGNIYLYVPIVPPRVEERN